MSLEICRINTTRTGDYHFIEKLLIQAFPKEEYRELADFRFLTIHESHFHNNLIANDGVPLGLVTYWDMGAFCYIEHFAILPKMRNRGYGHEVLEYLKTYLDCPLVLEVECPVEEMARRRIAFYQRQGFLLWQHDYLQPPYRSGDTPLPMLLMVYGALDETADFESVKRMIHQVVYNYQEG